MKNRHYRIHPGDYAIGENEAFYSRMEEKGLQLVNRGVYLSRFEKAEPRKMKYRIELSTPKFLEDEELPDEQIAVYEDCGWEFVTRERLVHVFRAPEENDQGEVGTVPAEFYESPEQHARTLKTMRLRYVSGIITFLIMIGVYALMYIGLSAAFSHDVPAVTNFASGLQKAWVEDTAFLLAFGFFWGFTICAEFYGTVRILLLYRSMKKGHPLNHAPKKRYGYLAVRSILAVATAVFVILAIIQYASSMTYDMPVESEGEYLLLTNLGWQGERSYLVYQDNTSEVTRIRSLLAERIETREMLADGEDRYWLYQDIYTMKSAEAASEFVVVLMHNATFVQAPEKYEKVEVTGLDEAWRISGGLEYIARKGNRVAYLTYSEPGLYGPAEQPEKDVLQALADLWQ